MFYCIFFFLDKYFFTVLFYIVSAAELQFIWEQTRENEAIWCASIFFSVSLFHTGTPRSPRLKCEWWHWVFSMVSCFAFTFEYAYFFWHFSFNSLNKVEYQAFVLFSLTMETNTIAYLLLNVYISSSSFLVQLCLWFSPWIRPGNCLSFFFLHCIALHCIASHNKWPSTFLKNTHTNGGDSWQDHPHESTQPAVLNKLVEAVCVTEKQHLTW